MNLKKLSKTAQGLGKLVGARILELEFWSQNSEGTEHRGYGFKHLKICNPQFFRVPYALAPDLR
jgi:hypothetical protein